jgi:hypothetical protein
MRTRSSSRIAKAQTIGHHITLGVRGFHFGSQFAILHEEGANV